MNDISVKTQFSSCVNTQQGPASGTAGRTQAITTGELPGTPGSGRAEGLGKVVDRLNHSMLLEGLGLRYKVDSSSGHILVQVIELGTDRVVRQIPSKEMLALASRHELPQSLIFDKKA